MAISRIDDILSPDYVDGLETLPIADVRSRRDECQEAADELSYLRRMVQGRLDIVHADLQRRAGGEPGDLHDLVEQLKRGEIIADGTRSSGLGRLPHNLDPADLDGWIARELDLVIDANRMSTLPDLDEHGVREMADQLTELERRVSEQRGKLHDRANTLQEEIVRRYKSGEATVDSLLK
jgi:anti-sigma-K factor RsiG